MFDKIIVPLDGSLLSEQIVPYAGALAKGMHIPVELLHVVDPNIQRLEDTEDAAHPVFYDQLLGHRQTWGRVYLQGVAQRLEANGIVAEPRVVVGVPEHEIVEIAGGAQLVAMATHGRAGIERMVMGSVADNVLHEGKMPLLLFHPRNHRAAMTNPPRTVFVALDGSASAERALAVAQYTARAVGARLLLVRVVVPAYSYALATPEVVAFGTYTDAMTLARTETRSYLEERERDTRGTGLEVQSVMLEGHPAQELVRLASTTPDSLMVMTTHGRSGIRRSILGSVADEIVRRAGTPVLLLRAMNG